MMRILYAALLIWLMAILQIALPGKMEVLGARPDFLLLWAVVSGMVLPTPACLYSGFFAGLVQGCLTGASLTQYVITRMFASFLASRIQRTDIQLNAVFAAILCAAVTIAAQILMLFLAPPKGTSIAAYLGDTMRTALYNAVLAMPLYGVLSRVFKQAPE